VSSQDHYIEKVAYLPDCYQVDDSKCVLSERVPERSEMGLPEQGFVFCCFNAPYKITPPLFEVWMRLLRSVPGSVLWLLQDSLGSAEKLRFEAAQRGVDPARFIFAPRSRLSEHLVRQQLADLFLDTLPINAHTTASDALRMGVPLLTCVGNGFAGRVAAGLLHAVGLTEQG
jgi:protein O-GlcNAc transferase